MDSLDIERTWLIECWRCSNKDTLDGAEAEARASAEYWGWAKIGDGFQVCPQCSGRGPK